jgi:hypothetical protein
LVPARSKESRHVNGAALSSSVTLHGAISRRIQLYSRRQLFANAAIAASCVGVRSS